MTDQNAEEKKQRVFRETIPHTKDGEKDPFTRSTSFYALYSVDCSQDSAQRWPVALYISDPVKTRTRSLTLSSPSGAVQVIMLSNSVSQRRGPLRKYTGVRSSQSRAKAKVERQTGRRPSVTE